MPDDGFNFMRVAILVIALFGAINSVVLVRRQPGQTWTLGGITMSKSAWAKSVLAVNAVGITLLGIILFGLWRP